MTARKARNRFLSLLAVAALAAAPQGNAQPRRASPAEPSGPVDWNSTVTRTPALGYVVGNPAAPLKLVSFISYTCPHCAAFEGEAQGPLRLTLIAEGKGSWEVRSFVRDPVDLTVALLTRCGPTDRFFLNHSAFLGSQAEWIKPALRPSPAQQQRWFSGALGSRLRFIAADFKFYEIMGTRGYTRGEVDKCLANLTLARQLAEATDAAQRDYKISGTPSFLINNTLLAGTFNWDTLRPQIEARLN